MKPMLLDCTLRDGAYIVESQFGESAIRGIIHSLENVGAEIIECGWLKNQEYQPGSVFYHVPSDLERYLSGGKKRHITYAVMIDWDRYDLNLLPDCDGKSVDAVRVVFPHGKRREGADVGRRIAEKGYQVFFQAADTLAYNDKELQDLAEIVNSINMNTTLPVSLTMVDTFGAMYEEDLERISGILNRCLSPKIALGFHSHNNQQLSFALTARFIRLFRDSPRQIIVDASLCGMGRGAGNATTELVVSYLNRKCDCHYDLDAVMDAIDVYMGYFQERYQWGYSTPYFIAGLYHCHVNNIAYLLNNHRTNTRDMRNIIASMKAEDRRQYDYDLLEKTYLSVVNRQADDSHAASHLKKELWDREILLIAPGKSVITERERVNAYITEKHPVIIGVNAMISGYNYDYVFYVNPARYEYAKVTNPTRFYAVKRIILSNIKTNLDKNEFIIAFDHAIKRGWPHFDNAVICALRMLDWLGMQSVSVAGFDGFRSIYNESYADPLLPSLNPKNNWDELNEEIREIFREFKDNAVNTRNIQMLTESYFA